MSTQQLTATLTLSDGSESDVTDSAAWESSDDAVATVSASGLVTAVAVGECTITATAQGKSGTSAITVTNPALDMTVTPSTVSLDLSEG